EVLTARALQLQARGDAAGALVLLGDTLDLARQVQSRAGYRARNDGRTIEQTALFGVQNWALALGRRPDLLEQDAAGLDRHEAARPLDQEAVLAEYLLSRAKLSEPDVLGALAGLVRPDSLDQWPAGLATLGRLTPWEQERARRLLVSVYAGFWRGAASAGAPETPGPPDARIDRPVVSAARGRLGARRPRRRG